MGLLKQKEKHLNKKEIEELFPLVNKNGDWKINIDSYQLVDKIIEIWFQTQGYDYWENPYPEVVEWEVTNEREIFFKYVSNVDTQ